MMRRVTVLSIARPWDMRVERIVGVIDMPGQPFAACLAEETLARTQKYLRLPAASKSHYEEKRLIRRFAGIRAVIVITWLPNATLCSTLSPLKWT